MTVSTKGKRAAVVFLKVTFLAAAALSASCLVAKTAQIFPPDVSGRPYLRQYGRIESFTVWVIDGQYVRENVDEEFTNFGQHYRFRFIPALELWLDQENTPGEDRFFIQHLLIEHRLMSQGMDYDRALERADAAEELEREKAKSTQEGEELLKSGRIPELLSRIHQQRLNEYGNEIKVWVVNGELVRSLFFIDFTEGGHDKVYKFIPGREVWIDDDVMPGERSFILLHEMHERYLMSRGWFYSRAHKDSSRIEFYCRRHPGQLGAKLKEEIERNGSAVPPLDQRP
jgi:hypothetical protein